MTAFQVVARNYSEASENRIHSDEIARRYGFRGALVPGVAVYGHMTRPLVECYGERWLGHSTSSVRFLQPAYDGDTLQIRRTEDETGEHVQCTNAEGTLLASLDSTLPGRLPDLEDQSCFDGAEKSPDRVDMTWENVTVGQRFRAWHWQITEDGNQTYARQVSDDLAIYRFAAHPHWILSTANTALTREFVMPAWIHVGSEIRFREQLKAGDTVKISALPVDKWERKGHQFVKLYLAYSRDTTVTTEIFHTAIFRVAE